jgi:SET domain-containing protein
VFAGRRFRAGEVLERCPILCVSAKDRALLERTGLRGYVYHRQKGAGAIALGFGSLYNHSADPNAECELVLEDQVLVFRALRDIAQDEEIRISYCDEADLWFDARDDEKRTPLNGARGNRSRHRRDTKR